MADGDAFVHPSTYPAKVYWLWRYLGWWRTLLVLLVKPVERVTALVRPGLWFQDFTERQFDLRYGVDTHRRIQLDEIGDLTPEQQAEANEYGPTRVMDFGPVIAELGVDMPSTTLFDVGSGQGKVLLMAMHFPFRRVVGVELSRNLHVVAEDNLRSYTGPRRAGSVECLLADALEVEIPDGPVVVFMFNPFPPEVLGPFLDRLEASLRADPRPMVLAYGNADEGHHEVMAASSILRRRAGVGGWMYEVHDVVLPAA